MFEVLEPNWAKLMSALPKCADLDAVIQLHEGTLQVGRCCNGRQLGSGLLALLVCTAFAWHVTTRVPGCHGRPGALPAELLSKAVMSPAGHCRRHVPGQPAADADAAGAGRRGRCARAAGPEPNAAGSAGCAGEEEAGSKRGCLDMAQHESGTAPAVGQLLLPRLHCSPPVRTLNAAMRVQGPIRRLADAVEQSVQEQAMYVQRAAESERAGEWNADVSAAALLGCGLIRAAALVDHCGRPWGLHMSAAHQASLLPTHAMPRAACLQPQLCAPCAPAHFMP